MKNLVAPPRESRNIIVSLESMYGTCGVQATAKDELHEALELVEPIKTLSTIQLSE